MGENTTTGPSNWPAECYQIDASEIEPEGQTITERLARMEAALEELKSIAATIDVLSMPGVQRAIEEAQEEPFVPSPVAAYAALLAAVDVLLDLSRRDLICDDEGTYTVDFVEAVDALREAREKVR